MQKTDVAVPKLFGTDGIRGRTNAGVMAGKAAGCKVVGLTTTHTNEELSATDFNIENFNIEPKSILERLF